jgi:hypothetical protein
MLWDTGLREPLEDPHRGLKKGHLAFILHELLCGVARYVAFSTRRQSTERSAFRQRHIIAFRPQPGASEQHAYQSESRRWRNWRVHDAAEGDALDRHWYIDQHGRRAFDGDFSVASTFFKGVAHVRLRASDPASRKASFAYIDTKGQRFFMY